MDLMSSFPLSRKYIDFCNTVENVDADFLEGTTASGKTTVGAGVKFMRMVSRSNKKLHILAAKTVGVAEKNLISQDNGILDIHRNAFYFGNGNKDFKIPHIQFEDKIIYVLGYDNKDKWKLVLGGQYGCVYIDEINTANIEFVREMSTRNDYMMATLNPDNPDLPIYKEFINRSRPYKKYVDDVPDEIMSDLIEPANPKWRYWFFNFRDNLSLTPEQIQKKIDAAPVGTKLYKNKILGLRGRATGLVFINFDSKKHVVDNVNGVEFKQFTAGLDTAYSANSADTIAMIYQGITVDGRLYVLDEEVYNNAERREPFAPSDVAKKFIVFLEKNRQRYGFAKDVFIDSADQATITELRKNKRQHGSIYNFVNAYKKTKIIDRINLQIGWIAESCYLVMSHCKEHIKELNLYSWKEDKDEPEDGNDHTINASQYAWLPFKQIIGRKE